MELQTNNYVLVLCPAPSLDEEGSGDTRGFFVTDWNAISAEWAGFLSCNRKNDIAMTGVL